METAKCCENIETNDQVMQPESTCVMLDRDHPECAYVAL